MSIATTIGEVAIGYAKEWKRRNCTESNNQSSCFQYLFDNRYDDVSGKPWCAATVSAILIDACKRVGIANPFRWTLSAWNLYEQASEMPDMRIDDEPAPGSVFVYPATSSYTAHTGIVIGVTSQGIYTVEGNASDAIKCYGCPSNAVVVLGNSALRTHAQMQARRTVYVHTEELGGREVMLAGVSVPMMLLLGSVAAGAWYFSQKKGRG